MVGGFALHSLCSLFAQALIEKLFHGVLMYYINMGASQFLRDCRRTSLVKKSAELRKRVLQRKKKTKEKTDCVPYQVKMSRVYLKSELTALCQAYGLKSVFKIIKVSSSRSTTGCYFTVQLHSKHRPCGRETI